ncbi:hypothetical protein Tco_0628921 [Tanacetum coccineum]|uniref:Uncharacterized protein n=1 Tax=Tanacetum coccineum TaxID=301880 RepID=A0ABQ4WRN5_9ASTR
MKHEPSFILEIVDHGLGPDVLGGGNNGSNVVVWDEVVMGQNGGGGESDEEEVEGVGVGRRGLLPLDLNRKTLLPFGSVHTHTFTRNFENLSKVFESESGFDIVDDERNEESSIEVLNKGNTFVKLKNEEGENMFINVEKTIKTNCRKDVAKIWFIIEEVRKDNPSFVKESIYERLVNLPFFAGKASGTMIHGDVVGGVMMINVG